MVSTHSPNWQESFSQAAEERRGERENSWYNLIISEVFFLFFRTTLIVKKWILSTNPGPMRILLLTCVAQGSLRFGARLVVPLALVCIPFNVHLNAILVSRPFFLSFDAIVWFTRGPVGCFICQNLIGAHPGPDVVDLADANPVVAFFFRQPVVEMLYLVLVLDGHQVCIVLPAPGSCMEPVHGGVGVVVGPALDTSPHAQHWGQKR